MKPKSKIPIVVLGLAAASSATVAVIAIIAYLHQFGGHTLSADPGDWGVFGDFVGGVMNPFISLVNIAVVVFIAYTVSHLESQREEEAANAESRLRLAEEERARKDRSVSLHEYFLNPAFYAQVRAPAYQVSLSWSHLPNDLKEKYRNIVIQGWVFSTVKDKLDFYVTSPPDNLDSMAKYHFQSPRGLASLTEHQALSALLRFWTRIRILLKENLIDHKVTKELFRDQFCYDVAFFDELSKGVTEKLQDGMVIPRWIDDIDYLKRFFSGN